MKSKKELQDTWVQKDKDENVAMGKDISVHSLLLRLKEGHEQVLDVLYPRYGKIFYAYACRHHLSHEDAEDVVQAVFWRVLSISRVMMRCARVAKNGCGASVVIR